MVRLEVYIRNYTKYQSYSYQGLSHFFPPIRGGWRMVIWHPLLEWRRAHSRKMENLTSSPLWVKNEEFSQRVSPQASCFSHGVVSFTTRGEPCWICGGDSPFCEKATKGCHAFLLGEAIMLAPHFPHSPFSEIRFSDLRKGVTTPIVKWMKPRVQSQTMNLIRRITQCHSKFSQRLHYHHPQGWCRAIRSWFSSLSWQDGWAKLALYKLIWGQDNGSHAYAFFQSLKLSQSLRGGKRRSQSMHLAFKIGSKT